MSVAWFSECPNCGGEITLRPFFYPQGFMVRAGLCTNCGHSLTQASKEVMEREDWDEGLHAAIALRKRKAEEDEFYERQMRMKGAKLIGVRPEEGDELHRCETCRHYAEKEFPNLVKKIDQICLEIGVFPTDENGIRRWNSRNQCKHWEAVE